MPPWCSHDAPSMSQHASRMCPWCLHDVSMMLPWCLHDGPTMFPWCPHEIGAWILECGYKKHVPQLWFWTQIMQSWGNPFGARRPRCSINFWGSFECTERARPGYPQGNSKSARDAPMVPACVAFLWCSHGAPGYHRIYIGFYRMPIDFHPRRVEYL